MDVKYGWCLQAFLYVSSMFAPYHVFISSYVTVEKSGVDIQQTGRRHKVKLWVSTRRQYIAGAPAFKEGKNIKENLALGAKQILLLHKPIVTPVVKPPAIYCPATYIVGYPGC